MTEENAITTVGQAGDAGSRDPAEGSVAAGESADPVDDGQSAAASDAGSAGASAQEPAEGPA